VNSNCFFENRTVYYTMGTGHTACWIPEATNVHSECVIFIAFLLQQCLHQGASVLLYTYIECTIGFCSYLLSTMYTYDCCNWYRSLTV